MGFIPINKLLMLPELGIAYVRLELVFVHAMPN